MLLKTLSILLPSRDLAFQSFHGIPYSQFASLFLGAVVSKTPTKMNVQKQAA